MKYIQSFLLVAIISVLGVSCSNNSTSKQKEKTDLGSAEVLHGQHNSLANNFKHKDIAILSQVYIPDTLTIEELGKVVDAYIILKNSLVADDEQAADHAAFMMAERIAKIYPENLDGKGLETWQNHQVLYLNKLKEMQHIKNLENKRSYFSHISEIMYCTIKSFGLKPNSLFVDYCPMAFNGKGAYWISEEEAISNPYFGEKMPECGEIKEEL